MTNYNELNNNLETLNLLRMKELLPNTIEKSIKSNISLQESLLELTRAEIAFKDERAKKINITVSNFPYIKTCCPGWFYCYIIYLAPSANASGIYE